MNSQFNFNSWLAIKLLETQGRLELSDYTFDVVNEQDFLKNKDFTPNHIYVVIKKMSNALSFDYIMQPYQVLILCEQNQLDVTQILFKTIAQEYNFKTLTENNTFIKFSFTDPVVMSNFNEVLYGYRSVMYMTSTLIEMEGVGDITNLKINNEELKVLGTSLGYSMSPDTQQMNKANTKNFIASSVKSASSLSINFNIPLVDKTFVKDVLKIMNEVSIPADPQNNIAAYDYDGNNTFTVSFTVLGVEFTIDMKLVSAGIRSTPNEVPMLEVGLVK